MYSCYADNLFSRCRRKDFILFVIKRYSPGCHALLLGSLEKIILHLVFSSWFYSSIQKIDTMERGKMEKKVAMNRISCLNCNTEKTAVM